MKKIVSLLSLLFFSYFTLCANYLDELACKFGTDKSSKFHNYTEVYDNYFSSFREKNIKFLEIGIAGLSSVKMWDYYFEHNQAELCFIDIDDYSVDKCKQKVIDGTLSPRVKPYKIDQADKKQLAEFCSRLNCQFDVIIDDGGHMMEQQITSFCFLFPYVARGGVYVIEDLHTSFWEKYGGGGSQNNPLAGPGSTLDFLMRLVVDVNYIGGVTGLGDVNKCGDEKLKNYYQRHIKSIHFYNSLCFIFKY